MVLLKHVVSFVYWLPDVVAVDTTAVAGLGCCYCCCRRRCRLACDGVFILLLNAFKRDVKKKTKDKIIRTKKNLSRKEKKNTQTQ